MNLEKGDTLVERGAAALETWARDLAVDGGFRRQVAEELVEDAAFLRKLKPSLIAARARGETPHAEPPAWAQPPAGAPEHPSTEADTVIAYAEGTAGGAPEARPRAQKGDGGGPNPFVVIAGAFVAGILLAKVVDWRGHAHPRR